MESLPNWQTRPLLDAVELLRAEGVHVQALVFGGRELGLDWAGAQPAHEDQLEALSRLSENIVELRLAGQTLGWEWTEEIARLPRLKLLDISRCEIEAKNFDTLAKSPALRRILLAGTALEDASAVHTLLSMQSLEEAVITATGITETGLSTLRARQSLRVIGGPIPLAQVLEQEPEVVFEKYGEAGQASAPPATEADALQASNLLCPLTGEPVDAKFRLVFEDRVLGFCCANCLADFAAEPDSYRDQLPE